MCSWKRGFRRLSGVLALQLRFSVKAPSFPRTVARTPAGFSLWSRRPGRGPPLGIPWRLGAPLFSGPGQRWRRTPGGARSAGRCAPAGLLRRDPPAHPQPHPQHGLGSARPPHLPEARGAVPGQEPHPHRAAAEGLRGEAQGAGLAPCAGGRLRTAGRLAAHRGIAQLTTAEAGAPSPDWDIPQGASCDQSWGPKSAGSVPPGGGRRCRGHCSGRAWAQRETTVRQIPQSGIAVPW